MRKIILFALCSLFLMGGSLMALPTLTIDGDVQTDIRDADGNVTLSFDGNYQNWTMLAEFAGWRAKNIFGYYNQTIDPTVIFPGSASPVETASTNIAAGEKIGLWLLADHNKDGNHDSGEPYLFSQRNWMANSGTDDNDYQYFYVYDVSSFIGTGVSYDFDTPNSDFSTTGDFNYLIYIDDSGAGPDYDHNDMIIGVSAIPEPGTLLLLGLGMAAARFYRRNKK